MAKTLITEEGKNNLLLKLKQLQIKEKECRENLLEAKSASSEISENVEFEIAKEEMMSIDKQIKDILYTIENCIIVDKDRIGTDIIQAYNKVTILDLKSNKEYCYTLVSDKEIDVKKGMISYTSPIGKSLIGKKKDDIFIVNIPSGTKEFKIISITV